MAEQYLPPNHSAVQLFTGLEVNEVTEMPLDVLTPAEIDDMTSSHTSGPIEVYALRVRADASAHLGHVVLWIADGHHRYYDSLRERRTTIAVRRVIPNPEQDIRVRFDAPAGWEEI